MKNKYLLFIIFILLIVIIILILMIVSPSGSDKSADEEKNRWEILGLSSDKMDSIMGRSQHASPKLLENQCNIGNSLSCFTLGSLYGFDRLIDKANIPGFKKDPGKSIELYLRACDLGESLGCGFAVIFLADEGKNFKKLLEVAELGCELNDPVSCGIGGAILTEDGIDIRDYKKAYELSSKGCDLKNLVGCHALGMIYENGYGVERDYHRASELFLKGCSGNFGLSCVSIGFSYVHGNGVRQDLRKAKEYFGKACDLGEQTGCDRYRALNEMESSR